MERKTSEITEGILKHLEHNYNDGKFEMTVIMIEKDGGSERQEFYGYIPRSEKGKEVCLYQFTIPTIKLPRKLRLTQKLTIMEDGYQIIAKSKQDRCYRL